MQKTEEVGCIIEQNKESFKEEENNIDGPFNNGSDDQQQLNGIEQEKSSFKTEIQKESENHDGRDGEVDESEIENED
jgi:hypothetical protein